MTREEIHKLPWKAQEYINELQRKFEHKAKVLTKEEVEKGRSNAYKYLDL